ncbi:MAG: ribose 5-phosphate isomerase B [Deltaproteobacteria bacterium]|nr:ribose 5-phosphate isomerase B [Deltaproteobacteria bacterium]
MSNEEKNIVIASDHNGIELKKIIHSYLKEKSYNCIDLGPYDINKKVDYTDYASQLGQIVNKRDVSKGILVCGTGVGMSIMANRFPNVRAALIHNLESAPKCREHNDSNVLCLGAWITSLEVTTQIVDMWLDTPFGEGRHVKRVERISYHRPGKIVFTNGVFDVLHTGHIELIKFAKSLGSKLIVGINSDRAVKELKGPSRPINSEGDRKKLLESIQEVDEVIIFDDVKTKNIIEQILPDVVVKGGEWTAQEVKIRDAIPEQVEVKIFPFIEGYSTTQTLKKIKEKETWEKL